MKIVLVTPVMDHGGGQRFISELANYWSELEHNVTIVFLRSGSSFYKISEKIDLIPLGYDSDHSSKILNGLIASKKLRSIIKNKRPDFVLSILSSTNVFTLASTRLLGIDVFVNDIMNPLRKRSSVERWSRRILYKRAKGIIALTEAAKTAIYQETKSPNIKVIPNPIKKIQIPENRVREKVILNVGRLDQVKGQEYLIDICAKLNRKDWKFVIAGDGPLKSRLEKKIKDLGLTSQIELIGAVKDVDSLYASASIFAFTSLSEAWGIALAEAMTAGIPVVSFDCPVGPREMIRDGENGYLVPLKDIDSFVERLEILMADDSIYKKFSTNAKIDSEQWTIEIIGKRILEFCSSEHDEIENAVLCL